ncbi:hypothetical protein WSM22_02500 [Cytophagales bacterium WSM2-2]|nr:hypothetical protein WSM22_02500 [Cytophagales bacterium WSM2-2]
MISSFEYVTVLMSIVLGLGITQILTSLARLIQKRKQLITYWPHSLWIVFILFLHIQEWWVMYDLRTYMPWRLPVFIFIMLYPVNLFIMAKLLFPDTLKGKIIDLKKFYFENYSVLFTSLVFAAILSLIHNLFILQLKLADQALQVLLIVAFSIITLKKYSNEWIHKAISLTIIVVMCAAIVVEWDIWLIN